MLRILMLEDNPGDAELNAEQLREGGVSFEWRRVENEKDFRRALEEYRPDLILSDYVLPGFSGIEALRVAQEKSPFIPFIIISGALNEEAAVELLKSGAADYILKQNITRLPSAVKNALELKAAREEKARAEEELRSSYRELERRVQERTRELTGANARLTKEIEERAQAERALEESEERFRSVLDNSLDAAYRRDLRTDKYDYMSPVIEQITGYSAKEFADLSLKQFKEIIHPDDLPRMSTELEKTLTSGPPAASIVYRMRARDGKYRWLADNLRVIKDENGAPLYLVGIVRDVTRALEVEDALRRNEYELRSLVDNSPDLIFRVDRTLRYVFVNPAYERLTGIPREQLIGRTNGELGMSPQMVEFWRKGLKAVLESGREQSVEFDMKSFFGTRYFSARLIPEFAKTGLVETVLVIARDITERRRAEEQIRYISFHDQVTGLYNRAFFEEEIRRTDTERGLPVSVIMGDVNNLKLTNDVFGHDEGDRLLKAVADILRRACRSDDVIARWGGDEFAVILPKTDFTAADYVCTRIQQVARETGGTALRPSLAVGAATKDHRDQNIYQVIRQAEQLMYDYKLARAEENRERVFSSLRDLARERVTGYDAHIARLRALARRFGAALALPEEQLKDLELLADLHDMGKVVIPQSVLDKPGQLTGDEWETLKKIPETGFRIAKTFADTAKVSVELLSRGECWDGEGYPRGLKGEEIPRLSRIFLLIDAFDAMTHPRPYARTLTPEEAAEEIRRTAGRQFDPGLAERFLERVLPAGKEAAPT